MTARQRGKRRGRAVAMARRRGQHEHRWRPLLVRVGLLFAGVLAVFQLAGRDTPTSKPAAADVAAATRAPARPSSVPVSDGREVYGYVPYWEMDDGIVEHVAGTELTTLALFSVTQRRDGTVETGENGYRRVTGDVGRRLVDVAHERGIRVELVWSSFGSGKNTAFFSDADAQRRWIASLTSLAIAEGFDGINVDVEGLPASLVPAYAAFVGRLRGALLAGSPDAQLSVATGGGEIGAAMASAAASAGADRIFLMGYDYRTAGSQPGATAPLERSDGDEKDLPWSLGIYRALGVPEERTILGLPLYGMAWPVAEPEFGAAAIGRGEAWIPRRHISEIRESFEPTIHATESVEFVAQQAGRTWTAVYYDSPRSLSPKLALAEEHSLAGVGFWAIGYERGLSEYGKLIARFRAGG